MSRRVWTVVGGKSSGGICVHTGWILAENRGQVLLELSRNYRALDALGVEEAIMHDVYGKLVTNIVAIEPPVSCWSLTEAARKLQKHHPLLCAAFRHGEAESVLEIGSGGSVEVLEYNAMREDTARMDLERLFPDGSCGWRLTLCEGGRCFLLTYHHSFFDGVSVMMMLQDLLTLLDGEELVCDRFDEKSHLGAASFEAKRPEHSSSPSRYLWPRAERVVPFNERTTQFEMRVLPETRTTVLRQRCRAEGTSVQGALEAAMCKVMANAMNGGKGTPLSECAPAFVQSVINMRPHCNVGLNLLGNYVGCASKAVFVEDSFWALARTCKYELQKAIFAKTLHNFASLGDERYSERVQGHRFLKAFRKPDDAGISSSLEVSNRGAFQLIGVAHRILSVHVIRQESRVPFGTFCLLNACSVNGLLCLTMCYTHPTCSGNFAAAIANGLIYELLAACGRVPLDMEDLAGQTLHAVSVGLWKSVIPRHQRADNIVRFDSEGNARHDIPEQGIHRLWTMQRDRTDAMASAFTISERTGSLSNFSGSGSCRLKGSVFLCVDFKLDNGPQGHYKFANLQIGPEFFPIGQGTDSWNVATAGRVLTLERLLQDKERELADAHAKLEFMQGVLKQLNRYNQNTCTENSEPATSGVVESGDESGEREQLVAVFSGEETIPESISFARHDSSMSMSTIAAPLGASAVDPIMHVFCGEPLPSERPFELVD